MWPLKESAQPANLEKGYAALVTVTVPYITVSDSRQRFAGHAYSQRTDAACRTPVTGAERRLRSVKPTTRIAATPNVGPSRYAHHRESAEV